MYTITQLGEGSADYCCVHFDYDEGKVQKLQDMSDIKARDIVKV